MTYLLMAFLWGVGWTGAVCAGEPAQVAATIPAATPVLAVAPGAQGSFPMPQAPQIINLNLLNALIAVDAQDLAGVFGFIPEPSAAPALADYLLHSRSALKRFMKKGEKDLKEVGAISEWDQQVFRYLLAIYSSGALPREMDALPSRWLNRVSALSLAPALPLADITLRRKR